jgi:hypothetical protein
MTIDAAAGLAGGCQCGPVRYRLDAELGGASLCHCRMCQKASGGPFMAFAGLTPASALIVTRGAISTFASSDIAERGFCARCGTPLTYRFLSTDRISVTLGSLDDPNLIEPQSQLGLESKVSWLPEALTLAGRRTDEWLARRKIASVQNRQHPDRET